MSSSACQWTSLRLAVFSVLVVLGFLLIFLTYYKPNIKLPFLDIYPEISHQPCTLVCAEGAPSQDLNQNYSTELHMDPHHNDTQNTTTASGHTEPDTIVLIWMWPFGYKYDLNCSIFNITRCHLTDDRTLYHKAHGVLFHHRDINWKLDGMPKEPRPCFQKWIWSNMESPANSAPIAKLNDLFNSTCSYRLDSDIPVPYGYMVPVTSEDKSFKLPAKDKLVCWIVSNWKPQYKRVQFYYELKKHIKIQTYGSAFNKYISDEDYPKIVSSCKFYLSFENSIYKDYMTEKLFRPMKLGTVPIVLGPSRQNYEEHIPADSFIHANDFFTAKALAERLHYLDRNDAEYMEYFKYTNRLKVKESWFGKEHACKTCSYLQNHRECQIFHGLNKWYWG